MSASLPFHFYLIQMVDVARTACSLALDLCPCLLLKMKVENLWHLDALIFAIKHLGDKELISICLRPYENFKTMKLVRTTFTDHNISGLSKKNITEM